MAQAAQPGLLIDRFCGWRNSEVQVREAYKETVSYRNSQSRALVPAVIPGSVASGGCMEMLVFHLALWLLMVSLTEESVGKKED